MKRNLLRSLTLVLAFAVSGAPVAAQSVSLSLEASVDEVTTCLRDEVAVTVKVANPDRVDIAGYQLFLRFPAESFEVLRYEAENLTQFVEVGAPSPLGEGFEPCTASDVTDDWDDRRGADVVGVVVSGFSGVNSEDFDDRELTLGRFVFGVIGAPTDGETLPFAFNEETCHVPLRQSCVVIDDDGDVVETAIGEPVSVPVVDGGPSVDTFTCRESGELVLLRWSGATAGVDGFVLERDGDVIATLPPAFSEFTDSTAPEGGVEYVLLAVVDNQEGCRTPCYLERQLARFVRGDTNEDQVFDISDGITLLNYLFLENVLPCLDTGDVDDDGRINLTDVVDILNFLFSPGGGPPPRPPFPNVGSDPTPDDLVCEREG